MDRALVEQLLGEGLSLAEIGRRVGRDESTVGYWVARHGLRVAHPYHAPRGGIPRDELEELVGSGASIAEIARQVDRSKAAVRHWMARYGMRTHRARGRPPSDAVQAARAAGLAQLELACPRHGETGHVADTRGYFRCRCCRQEAVIRRRRRVKELLVAEAGGCCQLCGYDRSMAALEFHHLDPSAKRFGVAQDGMGRSIERLRAEARKCALLCSNCHAEVESGANSISGVAQVGDPG
jgi:transposase-like protein